jgi:putative tricarboxylic transport membrane protein
MKLSDTLSGLFTAIFGLAIVAYSSTFPPMPGQPVGPSLFPMVLGAGLALFGSVLAFSGARRGGSRSIELDAWVRNPRKLLNFVLVIASLLFYSFAVDRLGFFITAFIFLSVLFLAFRVPRMRILPLAAAVTMAIHYGFYSLLRVPLPWGVLEGIAW